MADTVRTLAALQSLLADNTTGNISPQDLRDMLVSEWTPEWVRYLNHRLPDETTHTDDDFFDADSSGDYTTTTVSGTATWTTSRGVLSVKFDDQTASDAAAYQKSLTSVSAPVTLEGTLKLRPAGALTSSEFAMAGLMLADGTASSSNSIVAAVGWHDTSGVGVFLREGTLTNLGGTQTQTVYAVSDWAKHPYFDRVYVRLVWINATTVTMNLSIDGVTWEDNGASNLTVSSFTPTHGGFWVSTWGGNDGSAATFDYLRRTDSDLSV